MAKSFIEFAKQYVNRPDVIVDKGLSTEYTAKICAVRSQSVQVYDIDSRMIRTVNVTRLTFLEQLAKE